MCLQYIFITVTPKSILMVYLIATNLKSLLFLEYTPFICLSKPNRAEWDVNFITIKRSVELAVTHIFFCKFYKLHLIYSSIFI